MKDMPSVASARIERSAHRMDLDLVLDGVIDDRIEAAYAIVELGERESKKSVEFQPTEGEEDLEVDDSDQYHEVPRSPECLRQDRRFHSVEGSPVRTVTRTVDRHPPRLVHVRGAVMPSRTVGMPVQKRLRKRHNDDHRDGGGIKAKLARMIFERQYVHADGGKSVANDERDVVGGRNVVVDSDEERQLESKGGRFVRSAMPLQVPVNRVFYATSPQNYELRDVTEKLEPEQSFSAEEICKIRDSLWRTGVNIHDTFSPKTGEGKSQVRLYDGSTTSPLPEVSEKSGQCLQMSLPFTSDGCFTSKGKKDFNVGKSLEDRLVPASLPYTPGFINNLTGGRTVPSENHPVSTDLNVGNFAQFPAERGTRGISQINHGHHGQISTWPVGTGAQNVYLLSGTGKAAPNANVGVVPYLLLPTSSRSSPNSMDQSLPGSTPDIKVEVPVEVRKDTDNYGGCSQRFTPDTKYYCNSLSRNNLIQRDGSGSYWDPVLLSERIFSQFGSLNSISKYYGSNPDSEAARFYSSNSVESKSCHDLTKTLAHLPTSARSQEFQDGSHHPQSPDDDFRCSGYTRPRSNGSDQEEYAARRRGSRRTRRGVARSPKKILPFDEALEMIKGGEFGSLRTIQKLYRSLKPRPQHNRVENDVQCRALENGSNWPSPDHEGDSQDSPLDLSSYRRRQSSDYQVNSKRSVPESHSSCKSDILTLTEKCYDLSSRTYKNGPHDSTSGSERVEEISKFASASNSSASEIQVTDPRQASPGKTTNQSGNPTDSSLISSPSSSLPNSHLPPKKRKLRQPSQSFDFSESKTNSSVLSDMSTPTNNRSATDETRLQAAGKHIVGEAGSPENQRSPSSRRVGGEEDNGGRMNDDDRDVSSAVKGLSLNTEQKSPRDEVMTENLPFLFSAVAVQDEDGDLPLHIAVAQQSVDVVEKLLHVMSQLGVSVDICNNKRQTALHMAVIDNQPQMVETLLRASASPNICDRKGNTAIHLAVQNKTLPCLNRILTCSRVPFDLDARNYEGLTALHIGVQLSQKDTVEALLANGADPNVTDGTNGRTPLFYGVETNNYAMASILLRDGADPCIASYSGCTPLQIATAKSFRNMTSILERNSLKGIETTANH